MQLGYREFAQSLVLMNGETIRSYGSEWHPEFEGLGSQHRENSKVGHIRLRNRVDESFLK